VLRAFRIPAAFRAGGAGGTSWQQREKRESNTDGSRRSPPNFFDEGGPPQLITLPTGSVLKVLGPPEHAASRFWDAPTNAQPRADAWFWTCGCCAEPEAPGRFAVTPCAAHAEAVRHRFERKLQRVSAYARLSARSL
jgi:hypothetical protein